MIYSDYAPKRICNQIEYPLIRCLVKFSFRSLVFLEITKWLPPRTNSYQRKMTLVSKRRYFRHFQNGTFFAALSGKEESILNYVDFKS